MYKNDLKLMNIYQILIKGNWLGCEKIIDEFSKQQLMQSFGG